MTGYIALAFGVFIFSIITVSFSAYGMREDRVRKRIFNLAGSAKKVDVIEEELSKPLSERLIKPFIKALSEKMNKIKSKNQHSKSSTNSQQSLKLKKMLRQAGLSIGVNEYILIRLFVIVGAGVFMGMICLSLGFGIRSALGGILGIYAGYVIMRFSLTSKISTRRKSMEQQMPDVLDMLSVTVEAGLGFEQALLKVIEHFEGSLIDELNITYREMTMGRSRRDALILLGERCEFEEVKTFSSSIVQAEKLGISIKNVLHTQAASMRTARRNKLEEKAMKLSVKILIPMVCLIFPVLLIVLMGPAAVKIISQFGG